MSSTFLPSFATVYCVSSGVWSQRSFGGKLGQDKRNPPNRQQRQEYNSQVHSCILSSYHSLCELWPGRMQHFKNISSLRPGRTEKRDVKTCTETLLCPNCVLFRAIHFSTEPSGGCLGVCPYCSNSVGVNVCELVCCMFGG